ncbi:MAG: tRNA (adenosine(37)-N6)-threonylcarbamoyltransferase complex ATPase subunit type 1 TsaE [Bergeyella sp.]
MQFTIHKTEEWQKIADEIFPHLTHKILLLKGNLGAGKTTFTQFLLKKFESSDEVSSPTYAIVNEYHSTKGKISHFDLYRMKSTAEVYDIGIDEYLDHSFFCIIEWPEIFEEELPEEFHEMTIENKDGIRKIHFR